MKKRIFTGSGVAIATPFTDDGIDFEKLGELIEFQVREKTDAIIICGTTGEASTMSDDEHVEAIACTVRKVNAGFRSSQAPGAMTRNMPSGSAERPKKPVPTRYSASPRITTKRLSTVCTCISRLSQKA